MPLVCFAGAPAIPPHPKRSPQARRTIKFVPTPEKQATPHAFVITVSDSCARGEREDLSGPAVSALLTEAGFRVTGSHVVADEQPAIEDALRRAATRVGPGGLVATTGGTGLTARDVTPEATRSACSRLLDGLAEQMRAEGLKETPFAVLSRGICGLLGSTLVVNLPGSPRGAATSLRALLPVLPHALRLLVDAHASHPDEASAAIGQQRTSGVDHIREPERTAGPERAG